MKRAFSLVMVMVFVCFTMLGCAPKEEPSQVEAPVETPVEETVDLGESIILSTTTSTENSGLLAYILPDFTEKTGVQVKVVAVGTGKALQMGKDGEADVLLVHAKLQKKHL